MKQPCTHRHKTFFACGSSAPVRVEREGGTVAWLAGVLVAPSVQGLNCLHHRIYGPLRVFFQASCSWQSEGLFGQSFSVARPIQALRGLPCLGSFSVVQCIRHIEGPAWVGSYSVVPSFRLWMGQPLYCSAANAGVWREAMVSSIALLPWLPGFPSQAFPTTISSLKSPRSVSVQSTAALTLRLLHNP